MTPYLFFDGRAEEAIGFYRAALGAEQTMLMRFSDNPEPSPPSAVAPGKEQKIMHAELRIRDTELMLSDGHCAGAPRFEGFALSLPARDAEDAAQLFGALAEGGAVRMPLGPSFFSPAFGMVQDRFGVVWMVIVPLGAS